MSDNRNLKWGIIFSYITMVAGIVVSMTYTPFMLRSLGSQQFGLFNMGQAAVSYLGLAEFGFGNAVVRYASKYRAEGNESKTSSLYGMFMYLYYFLAVIVFIVGIVICIFSSSFYTVSTGEVGYTELRIIILIMVINLTFTFATTTYSSIITSYERFTFLKVTNLIYTLLKPAVMIPLLIWGYKAVAMSVVTLVLTIALNVANIIYVKKVLHINIDMKRKHMEFGILKEIIGYSFFIFLGSIVGQLNDNTDTIILGVISGEIAVSVYSIGYQLNTYVQQIPGIIASVFFPRVTERVTKGASKEYLTDLMIRVGRIQYYIAFLLCVGFTIFGCKFIFLWAGSEYSVSYLIVLVLILPAIIPNIQAIPVLIIQAMNKHQFKAILYVVCAVLNVAFSIPAGLLFGPFGCAACTGITTLLTKGIIINWYYSKKINLGIGAFWKNICLLTLRLMPVAIAGILISFIPLPVTWLWLIVKVILFTVVFCLYAFFVCMNKEEKALITGILNKVFGRFKKSKT